MSATTSSMTGTSQLIPQPFPSSSSQKREEDLVYLFEAEEERITNNLSRKLERLKAEKVELENILEAENEAHVNRLSREISALRAVQNNDMQNTTQVGPATNGVNGHAFAVPPQDVMLEAMTRENQALRNRLAEAEQGYIRVSRLNDIYREELIELRRRLGLPIDHLIGLSASSPADTYSQPTNLRVTSSAIRLAPSVTRNSGAEPQRAPLSGLPIPINRVPSSQAHRAPKSPSSSTPNTNSPSPLSSPQYSPVVPVPPGGLDGPADATTPSSFSSYAPNPGGISSFTNTLDTSSYVTQATTPPSSTSPLLQLDPSTSTFVAVNQLSYPSVPPPSLSSSLGSPVYSRRNSFGQGHGRRPSGSGGARVAETGSLIRGRRMSTAAGTLSTETVPESEPEQEQDVSDSSPSSVVALGDIDQSI